MQRPGATRIAEVLGGLLTGQERRHRRRGPSRRDPHRARAAAAPASMNQGGQQGLGGSSSTSSNGQGCPEQDRIARATTATGGVVFPAATIQADPATNSLIISAPEPLYRSCAVIDQLDQRRAQVLVESLIVKSARPRRPSSASWMTGAGNINRRHRFIGRHQPGRQRPVRQGPTSIDALGGGMTLAWSGTVDVLGNKVINLGVLARAMQTARPTSCPRRTC